MAGRGPAPKPADRRARRNAGPQLTVIEFTPGPAPDLPDSMAWCEETLAWWRMWQESPLADTFSGSDWSFLLDTAILHHQLWSVGDTSVLAELRIRVAKFGATPEDRARLRIQFAAADQAEQRRDVKGKSPKQTYQGLKAVD